MAAPETPQTRESLMIDNVVRMVLFPRYSPFFTATAAATFYTAPFSVKRFGQVLLTAWAGQGSTATFLLEQSTDLEHWHPVGNSFSPASAGTEVQADRDLAVEWARFSVVVGSGGGVSLWASGAFVLREGVR